MLSVEQKECIEEIHELDLSVDEKFMIWFAMMRNDVEDQTDRILVWVFIQTLINLIIIGGIIYLAV